jgi:ligand-binding sensor domain-containing protein/signal transduction histidine kinase
MASLRYLFTVALFCCSCVCMGRSYYFKKYQVEQGLSSNSVLCSVQDSKGFMWFGTRNGLNRFDGYTFKTFKYDADDSTSIGNNSIKSLHVDRKGRLWVGTITGLYLYQSDLENFRPMYSKKRETRDIQSDIKGNVWFICGTRVYVMNGKTNHIDSLTDHRFKNATTIAANTNGDIWIADKEGMLYRYDPTFKSIQSYDVFINSSKAISKWIQKLYISDNKIFIGTRNQGAKIFNLQTSTYKDIIIDNGDHKGIYVRNFIKYNSDEYWMATETGLYIYQPSTGSVRHLQKNHSDPYAVSDNAIHGLTLDQEGGLWIGTYYGGINYCPSQAAYFQKFYPTNTPYSISGNFVGAICQDKDQNLWIGTKDAGLNKFDQESGRFYHFGPSGNKSGISYSNIHGLLATGNQLWIGTFENGLDVMDIRTGKVIKHYNASPAEHHFKSNFITCIYQTRKGTILIGTKQGLYAYNASQDNFIKMGQVPVDCFINAMLEDKSGMVWVGTNRRLYYFNEKISGSYNYDKNDRNSLSYVNVTAVFEDSNNRLWFGTESGGLCLYRPKQNNFKRFNAKNGFPGNTIYHILEDDRKQLWITTSAGLVNFDPRNYHVKTYTKADGLLSDQFDYSSGYKDQSGKLYFGNVWGMISFDPAAIKNHHFEAPVYITGLRIFNNSVPINGTGSPLNKSIIGTQKITLRYDQATFSFDFAALSYTAPEKIVYEYQMEGLSQEWINLKGNRNAFFAQLAPGKYNFKIRATSGYFGRAEAIISIVITPPFWASPLAYILYALIIIIAVLLLFRAYHNRLIEKNKRNLAVFEYEKEKEIYRAKIEFFTHVAHEIRTPLTLIRAPMEMVIDRANLVPAIESDLKIMQKNTDRLLELTNQLLDFRSTEIKGYSLNFVRSNISDVLHDHFLRFQPAADLLKLNFVLLLPPEAFYAYVDKEAFNKIISNLVDNAIKYAVSKVSISLSSTADENLQIEIQNDGSLIPTELQEKIFEPFYRLRENHEKCGTGIGLSLARALAELHNGSIHIKPNSARTNTFILSLPVHHQIEFNSLVY